MELKIIIGLIGVAVMIALLFMRMWIGVAMLLVGIAGLAVLQNFYGTASWAAGVAWTQATFYTLTTIPVFIFMGNILMVSNIGEDLYNAMYAWLGHVRAGLVMATVPACALFGAITGVPTPAGVTLARVALPEMRKYGYQDGFSTSSIVAAATLAVLIPPSIPMIIYGVITETNITTLFVAGILPGILLTALFMIQIYTMARINPRLGPPGEKSSWKTRFSSLKLIWPAVVLFLLVLGGMYQGYVTPTEAGSLGAVGAIVIAALVIRRLPFKRFLEALLDSARLTTAILLLIMGAMVFGRFLALSHAGDWIVGSILGLQLPTWGIFAALVLMYIILGCLLDITSAVIITMPIVFPAVTAMGFDPIWLGVIVILIIQMGVITPPVGLDVFVMSGATNVPVGTIFKGVWPYVLTVLLCIVILYIFPQIALLLPSTMAG